MGETGVINLLKTDRAQDPYWNQYGVDNATGVQTQIQHIMLVRWLKI